MTFRSIALSFVYNLLYIDRMVVYLIGGVVPFFPFQPGDIVPSIVDNILANLLSSLMSCS